MLLFKVPSLLQISSTVLGAREALYKYCLNGIKFKNLVLLKELLKTRGKYKERKIIEDELVFLYEWLQGNSKVRNET